MNTQYDIRSEFPEKVPIISPTETDRLPMGEYKQLNDKEVDIVEEGGMPLDGVINPNTESTQP